MAPKVRRRRANPRGCSVGLLHVSDSVAARTAWVLIAGSMTGTCCNDFSFYMLSLDPWDGRHIRHGPAAPQQGTSGCGFASPTQRYRRIRYFRRTMVGGTMASTPAVRLALLLNSVVSPLPPEHTRPIIVLQVDVGRSWFITLERQTTSSTTC
jgi:hypothetical protein